LDESSWDHCLTFSEIDGRMMVTFIDINKTVIVDYTDKEIEGIITNRLSTEQT
jgi:hypothetical protein